MSVLRAFTLVEVLIVVVILGILAAIVIPSLTGAAEETAISATYTDLQKLRRAIGVYVARTGELPHVTPGIPTGLADGTGPWGELVNRNGEYFLDAPVNAYVGGVNAKRVEVVENAEADTEFLDTRGWIYDPVDGDVFAGGFDYADRPLPRNN